MAEDSSHPTTIPPEPPANEQVRLAFALEAISDARRFRDHRSLDEILSESGLYPNASAFWRALLSVPCRALWFTELLLIFQADPSESYAVHRDIKRKRIEHAVLEGIRNGAPWIFLDPLVTDGEYGFLASMRVHPREATLWLLASPWADIVPESLRAFLEASPRHLPPAAPPRARPGRPSSQELIMEEAERRLTANADLPPTLTQFGDELAAWLRKEHPEAVQMTGRTVERHIREMWNNRRKL